MRAIVFSKTGKMEEALALAEQCLISCQRLGLIRSVLDEGPNAMALVVELATRNTTDPLLEPFIQQLLWQLINTARLESPPRQKWSNLPSLSVIGNGDSYAVGEVVNQ